MTETTDPPIGNRPEVPWDTPYDHLNSADIPQPLRAAAKRLLDHYDGWQYGEASPSVTAGAAAYVTARRMGLKLTQADIGSAIGCSTIAIRDTRDKIEDALSNDAIRAAITDGVESDD